MRELEAGLKSHSLAGDFRQAERTLRRIEAVNVQLRELLSGGDVGRVRRPRGPLLRPVAAFVTFESVAACSSAIEMKTINVTPVAPPCS